MGRPASVDRRVEIASNLTLTLTALTVLVKVFLIRCRLKGGRYENLEVGNANTALVHFTGGVSFSIGQTDIASATIFKKVDYCLNSQGLVSCITQVRAYDFMYEGCFMNQSVDSLFK